MSGITLRALGREGLDKPKGSNKFSFHARNVGMCSLQGVGFDMRYHYYWDMYKAFLPLAPDGNIVTDCKGKIYMIERGFLKKFSLEIQLYNRGKRSRN